MHFSTEIKSIKQEPQILEDVAGQVGFHCTIKNILFIHNYCNSILSVHFKTL